MNALTDRQRLWFYRSATLLLTAVAFHIAAIWLAPRLIMWGVSQGATSQELAPVNGAIFPPPVDAKARRIVMPSPDLLYALCPVDLRQGAMRIRANPQWPNYWSVALYSANSDNYFVLNDRQADGKPVDLWVVPEGGATQQAPVPAGARVVVAPSTRGLLLMRVLVSDYASEGPAAEKARRSLQCTSSAP